MRLRLRPDLLSRAKMLCYLFQAGCRTKPNQPLVSCHEACERIGLPLLSRILQLTKRRAYELTHRGQLELFEFFALMFESAGLVQVFSQRLHIVCDFESITTF